MDALLKFLKRHKIAASISGSVVFILISTFVSYKLSQRKHKRNPNVRLTRIGNRNGPILVFIHGWPDTDALWDPTIDQIKDNYNCVKVSLPHYRRSDVVTNNWGYDFPPIIDSINRQLSQQFPNRKCTLIIHDWGSLIGCMCYRANPQLFKGILSLDIGDSTPTVPFAIFYQFSLILAFFLPSFIGDRITRAFATYMRSPLTRLNKTDDIHSGMNYLYFYLWKRLLSGDISVLKWRTPRVPLAFIRGAKNMKFFTQQFRNRLETKSETDPRYRFLEWDCSHWIMCDEKQRFWVFLKEWLQLMHPYPNSNGAVEEVQLHYTKPSVNVVPCKL